MKIILFTQDNYVFQVIEGYKVVKNPDIASTLAIINEFSKKIKYSLFFENGMVKLELIEI